MRKRLLACLLVLALLRTQGLPLACAETSSAADQVQNLIGGILAYQLAQTGAADVQAWLDGELARNAGRGAEWNAFALNQMGGYSLAAYRDALLSCVQEAGTLNAATRQRIALILLGTGGGEDFLQSTMAETVGAQGIMTWVYGLHLLNNGQTGAVSTADAVNALLDLQLPDGGWALRGDVSDVDVTAMTLQALAQHRDDSAVAQTIERAVEMLSVRQLETGDFISYGKPNPESAAQVLTALAIMGINAFEDERFIQNGQNLLDVISRFRLPDGSFAHEMGGVTNANATTQVLYSLVAWQRMMDGRGSIYLMDRSAETEPQVNRELEPKAMAAIGVAGMALIGCMVLLTFKKRSFKNYLFILALAACVIVFVLTTDFQTVDSYYTGTIVEKANSIGQMTMSIRCDAALGKTDLELPTDGVMLPETAFAIARGDTAYTILTEAARAYGVRLDTNGPQGMIYVAGINHLYEFACGELSGWTYLINGRTADIGCDQYALKDGDVIEWRYTCELGNDL